MKFIYLTSKKYPGRTADHFYIENQARAFQTELGSDFRLVACDTPHDAIPGVTIENVTLPQHGKRTLRFFTWVLKYGLDSKREPTTFFTNDQNLLAVLIFWKKILRFPWKIMADWHMLSETWRDKFIARNVDFSFSTSLKLENAIRNLAPDAEIYTVYGGVDLKPYSTSTDKKELRMKLGLPTEVFLAGYVGLFRTLGLEKGILIMIESLLLLPQNYMMAFVGGKKDEIEFYKQSAEMHGVADRCIFLPLQPFDKVAAYEKAMDALVIPYPDAPHFRNYGFPMKIYEYMASKVPIVYTKLDLLEEVVRDCAYGVLPDSPKEIANALLSIPSQEEMVQKMIRKAFDKVSKCTWRERARNILLCATM